MVAMRKYLIALSLVIFSVAASAGPKDALESSSYVFKTENGSQKISIYSKTSQDRIAEYQTAGPEAKLSAETTIRSGEDSILNAQNALNLVAGGVSAQIFARSEEAKDARRLG
jgi:hypothetical protein